MHTNLCIVLAMFLSAFPPPVVGQERPSIVPHGPEDAIRAVDRFIAAVNRADSAEVTAAFAPGARAFDYYLGSEQFADQEWLDHPSQYFFLQATRGPSDEIQVIVSQRIAAGSFVTQVEEWIVRDDVGNIRRTQFLTTYKIRGGRILRVWHFPSPPPPVPSVPEPRYGPGHGPVVWFDTWHYNSSTPDGLYFAFAELLRRDGYTAKVWERSFEAEPLAEIDLLVITNPLPSSHGYGGVDPELEVPSAFTEEEVTALSEWVRNGGSLLLIADHDPTAGASAALAREFGALFFNGSARDTARVGGGGDLFTRQDGTLLSHVILDGDGRVPPVDSVRTFLGQGFQIDDHLAPVLAFNSTTVLIPAGQYENPEAWISADDAVQAAAVEFGAGRVALFGEAWMFRFFREEALDGNARLLLNLFAWLSGELE